MSSISHCEYLPNYVNIVRKSKDHLDLKFDKKHFEDFKTLFEAKTGSIYLIS